jgi:uncharacterized protein YjbI with pentapeptide repeats
MSKPEHSGSGARLTAIQGSLRRLRGRQPDGPSFVKEEKWLGSRRYQEEIDDLREWDNDEAAHRIADNIKELNRSGVTDIRLERCYLVRADLERVDLSEADLSYANLKQAELREASLLSAKLRLADLNNANLEAANLRQADLRQASLFNAKLRQADLSGANLSHADLRQADLSSANLREANLSHADLGQANLSGADLREANLSGTKLRETNLNGADLSSADLSRAKNWTHQQLAQATSLVGATLPYAKVMTDKEWEKFQKQNGSSEEKWLGSRRYQEEIDDLREWDNDEAAHRIADNIKELNRSGVTDIRLERCYLVRADLERVDLSEADLSYANLKQAELREASLLSAKLRLADLNNANLEAANLRQADLRQASLFNAKLRQADLSGANLSHADLRQADLSSANLREANLSHADLGQANLSGADLSQANLSRAKNWTHQQLAQTTSLVGATLPYGKVMTNKDREKFQKQNGSSEEKWLENRGYQKDSTQEGARLEVEDSSHLAAENALLRELVETQRGQLQVLQEELEAKRRDIQELHVLLQRSQGQRE